MAETPSFSPREHQVLGLIAQGLRTREISARLGISESTVWTHRESIAKKLATHSPADL
ncbi:MAG: helix-turn-helix transcriptional regulator, partial [Myxococcales bacterium]|nr:helix-turn-helix transcriptional regulator [Myxococcales bacterium]